MLLRAKMRLIKREKIMLNYQRKELSEADDRVANSLLNILHLWRSGVDLWRIAAAGRLSEADINLLDQIARRIEGRKE